jgi:ribonuclease P protein component
VRVAFVVSRKVGKAVVRNRVRRRLREALRAMLRAGPDAGAAAPADAGTLAAGGAPRGVGPDGRWPASFDALVIVRPSAAEADYHELGQALRRALDQASAAPKTSAPKAASPKTAGPRAGARATARPA